MKKYLPYILAGLLALGIVTLIVTGGNKNNRKIDARVTLRRQDKIPYGSYVAFKSLGYLFPSASIYTDRREPGYWDSLSIYDSNQVFISMAGRFFATESELKKLVTFAEHGNDVFISARYFSAAADALFGFISSSYDLNLFTDEQMEDSMELKLNSPPFKQGLKYAYPGKKFSSYFTSNDTATTEILGFNDRGRPDFVHLRIGKGNFYMHMEPLAYSNYFLLYKENIGYLEKTLSLINPAATRVLWDEYYLTKKAENEPSKKRKDWLDVLFSFPSLKAAILTALATLLIYVLLEMRRKQRFIPIMGRPRNETLDFVKTIGRLYYDRGDHKNLSRKMASYFLEHVRNKYKLPTSKTDDAFIKALQFKTGYPEDSIRSIVAFITSLDGANAINDRQLHQFHEQLESFYKNT